MKSIPLSRLNFQFEHDRDGETNNEPSLTQPDQTMSLRDMISRYARGQSVPTFEPVYDGDQDMPDISRMSKIELEELRQDVLGEIQYQRFELNRKKELAAAAEAAEIKAAKESKPAAPKKAAKKSSPPPASEGE